MVSRELPEHTHHILQLEDTELNISWHCIICNNPNYSSTVHDYQTVDVDLVLIEQMVSDKKIFMGI